MENTHEKEKVIVQITIEIVCKEKYNENYESFLFRRLLNLLSK